jgi:hypothetical protein
MSMDDFDFKDPAMLGGLIGFIEQSIKEENMSFESTDVSDERHYSTDRLSSDQIRRLDPGLYYSVLVFLRNQQRAKGIKIPPPDTKTMHKWLNDYIKVYYEDLDDDDFISHPNLFFLDECVGQNWVLEAIYYGIKGEPAKLNLIIKRIFKRHGVIYVEAVDQADGIKKIYPFSDISFDKK